MNHRDCVFGEDACLTRTGPTNRASLDNIALAVIFANRRESLAEIPPFYATDVSTHP